MYLRDETTVRYFDESTVTVNDHSEGESFLSWFEHDTCSIARLAGAPTGSTVDIYTVENSFRIDVTGPYIDGTMVRMIRQSEHEMGPHLYIRNSGFSLPKELRRRKIGVRSVAIELFEAARTGAFHMVEVDAIGNVQTLASENPENQYSGYVVWPKLGFDGPLPAEVLLRHPELSRFKTVKNVLEADGGSTWTLKGSSVLLRFDLAATSPGWVVLGNYMADNQIEVRK